MANVLSLCHSFDAFLHGSFVHKRHSSCFIYTVGNFRNLLLDYHKAQFIMHYCSRRHHLFSTTDLPVHAQTCPLSSSDVSVTFTGTNSSFLQMSGKERFDWSQAEGARTVKRKHYLQHDDFGIYNCPVHHSEHGGFNSKRGCRKHIDIKHSWFHFFDEKPAVQQIHQ